MMDKAKLGDPEAEGTPEVWRAVVGWPEREVSSWGKVRITKTGAPVRVHSQAGYLVCSLSRPGQRKVGAVHRMVAKAFIPNADPGRRFVNHIDGNKSNPCVENLEWVTPRENTQHAFREGLMDGNPRRSRKVVSVNTRTGEETVYSSAAEAGKAVGVDSARIFICIKKPHCRAAGLQWKLHASEQPRSAVWKRLEACDGYSFSRIAYEVSDLGEVRNATAERLLRPSQPSHGYKIVNLTVDGQSARRIFGVHRLVASAFVPLPPGHGTGKGLDADHIDRNTANNTPGNLQWMSRQKHCEKTTGRQVLQIALDGTVVRKHDSIMVAAKSIGAAHQSLWSALNGRRRKAKGFRWAYADAGPAAPPRPPSPPPPALVLSAADLDDLLGLSPSPETAAPASAIAEDLRLTDAEVDDVLGFAED